MEDLNPQESYRASHSHCRVQHLIGKVELQGASLKPRYRRDVRAICLTGIIEQVWELFETYLEQSRVGLEC